MSMRDCNENLHLHCFVISVSVSAMTLKYKLRCIAGKVFCTKHHARFSLSNHPKYSKERNYLIFIPIAPNTFSINSHHEIHLPGTMVHSPPMNIHLIFYLKHLFKAT
ncbi:hypothetical protein PanWU01x14_261820 [Parasponia andersonii]|uniref:Uncharacterized protein n=1 Tax=Parasponia andersonii TaxID=3476 RepID=A0A2P5B8B0_PARAD|nr:hypothetical protein PanWU01x14_261820 [Parasponia andersonii]